jgi:hypothetical protein
MRATMFQLRPENPPRRCYACNREIIRGRVTYVEGRWFHAPCEFVDYATAVTGRARR